jgi:hypothetical protein
MELGREAREAAMAAAKLGWLSAQHLIILAIFTT